MFIQCKQQTGAMYSRYLSPMQARERAFECPKEIQTDIAAAPFGLRVGCDGTEPAQLRKRRDACSGEHLLGLGIQAWQFGEWNGPGHVFEAGVVQNKTTRARRDDARTPADKRAL